MDRSTNHSKRITIIRKVEYRTAVVRNRRVEDSTSSLHPTGTRASHVLITICGTSSLKAITVAVAVAVAAAAAVVVENVFIDELCKKKLLSERLLLVFFFQTFIAFSQET